MDWLLFLYLFKLFILLTPGSLFKLPIKNKLLNSMIHGLLLVFIFQLTYGIVNKSQIENLEVQGKNTGSLVNIIKLVTDKIKKPNDEVEINIINEVIQVTPDIDEQYSTNNGSVENTVFAPPV